MPRTSDTSITRKKGIIYQKSVPPPAGAHIARFAFGDYFVFFKVCHENRSFDITVVKETPKDIIEDFLEFWNDIVGGKWRVFLNENAHP